MSEAQRFAGRIVARGAAQNPVTEGVLANDAFTNPTVTQGVLAQDVVAPGPLVRNVAALEPDSRRVLPPLLIWALAFGLLEAAVVVYLRQIYYPAGFAFPLVPIRGPHLMIEVAREASTLVLLWGIAHLSARGSLRRFAAFCFCFGVWDLAFYLALRVLLAWPESLLTWDILFLIPLPWTGPVLAPALVALALAGAGAAVLLSRKAEPVRLRARDWGIEILCALVILAAFLWNVPALARGEAPAFFPWALFGAGLLGGLGYFVYKWRETT